jgi:A/G-specific adenine glycosylase
VSTTFSAIIKGLERSYGPVLVPFAGPFEFVLFELVAYLVPEARRADAFAALAERVGLSPEQIIAAPPDVLAQICALGGIYAPERAERLKNSAIIVLERCAGDLATLPRMPVAAARKLARTFPSFGVTNAESLLLFAGVRVPALDSNGVRVLCRVWYGGEGPRYAADHRRACETIVSYGLPSVELLTRGYLALQRHGRTICRRTKPECPRCPLQTACAFGAKPS